MNLDYHQRSPYEWHHGGMVLHSIGIRQDCLLSPTLFNIFLERIMTDALEDHIGTVSIGGRTITNLRFVDDIDGLAGGEKTKIMTNTNGMNKKITVNEQRLETVSKFRYLGSVITD